MDFIYRNVFQRLTKENNSYYLVNKLLGVFLVGLCFKFENTYRILGNNFYLNIIIQKTYNDYLFNKNAYDDKVLLFAYFSLMKNK